MVLTSLIRVDCPAIRHLRTGDRACSGILTQVPQIWQPVATLLKDRHAATGAGELHPCPVCGAWSEISYEGLRPVPQVLNL
jgi:hypothetical protein